MQHMFVVTYDISDDDQRARVFDTLKSYGEWLQCSVFRCPLDATQLARIRAEVHEMINDSRDQVLFFDLGPAESEGANPKIILGKPIQVVRRTAIIL